MNCNKQMYFILTAGLLERAANRHASMDWIEVGLVMRFVNYYVCRLEKIYVIYYMTISCEDFYMMHAFTWMRTHIDRRRTRLNVNRNLMNLNIINNIKKENNLYVTEIKPRVVAWAPATAQTVCTDRVFPIGLVSAVDCWRTASIGRFQRGWRPGDANRSRPFRWTAHSRMLNYLKKKQTICNYCI